MHLFEKADVRPALVPTPKLKYAIVLRNCWQSSDANMHSKSLHAPAGISDITDKVRDFVVSLRSQTSKSKPTTATLHYPPVHSGMHHSSAAGVQTVILGVFPLVC